MKKIYHFKNKSLTKKYKNFGTRVPTLINELISSALISGTEVAFFSISQTELDELSENSKDENTIVKLLENPKKLLGTILITNNFINILIVLIFVLIFANVGKVLFSGIHNEIVLFLIEIVLVTFLILLFGEVLPKIYANRKSLQFANFMAKPIHILNIILTPLSIPLIRLTSLIENRLKGKNNNLSVEKLSQALELTSEDTNEDEQKIFKGIVTFGNTETVQIMKPRTEVCAISNSETYENVLKIILKNVYSGNIDNIVGVLYAKDLLSHLNKKQFKWQNLLREAFFVPENKKLDDLLADFQEMKNHMAIVVDEYGGTSGVVTLEDVIEEIVGDINDEFDNDDLSY
ncbi:MAG: magnesium/cobalt efflux protein, partial [Polaribacter sp.]